MTFEKSESVLSPSKYCGRKHSRCVHPHLWLRRDQAAFGSVCIIPKMLPSVSLQ